MDVHGRTSHADLVLPGWPASGALRWRSPGPGSAPLQGGRGAVARGPAVNGGPRPAPGFGQREQHGVRAVAAAMGSRTEIVVGVSRPHPAIGTSRPGPRSAYPDRAPRSHTLAAQGTQGFGRPSEEVASRARTS